MSSDGNDGSKVTSGKVTTDGNSGETDGVSKMPDVDLIFRAK